MTFDPGAWLAMIVAFYPAPTIANLRRAKDERPEYFGDGKLFGTCGEKLHLPTGRIWDLMFDCGGTRARWQAIDITDEPPGTDDPFVLEPGPLEELTLPEIVTPGGETVFSELVAGALQELRGSDDVLDNAGRVLTEAGAPSGLGDALQADLDEGTDAQQSEHHALEAVRPEELVGATNEADGVADTTPGAPVEDDGEPPAEEPPIDPGDVPDDDDQPPEA